MIVRRDVPRTGTQPSSLESGAKQSVAAPPESGYAKIIQSDRRFSSANSPEMLGFGLAKNEQEPPKKPAVVAVRPLERNDSLPVARSVVRLPQVVSKDLDADSGPPQTLAVNPANFVPTVVPTVVPADPFPSKSNDQQESVMVAVVPADPFPLLVNNQPRFAEVRNREPQIQTLPEPIREPTIVTVVPVRPMPVIVDTAQSPRFAEVKNIEPHIRSVPEPTAVAHVPADPFSVVAHNPAKFAEVQRIEPQTPGLTRPVPVTALPADPFVVATNPLPVFTEVKKSEPSKQTAATALPLNRSPEMDSPPVLTAAKQPEPLPRVSPAPVEVPNIAEVKPFPIHSVPVREEPTGFASTRRAGLRVATSDDQQAGFARSRR